MAINAYTGLMGSGKSYEVVENVILPALLSGRRVVTNVANLQVDEINAYLVDSCGGVLDKLGAVVQVQNDDIEKAGFFPVEVKEGEPLAVSVVLPGDLVVIDECWRWWAAGSKISPAHLNFFRMHRHFVNQVTSHSCDLVLVAQDIGDLDRKLKVVVENTYRMTKHKALGSNKRYRVDLYTSYKTTRAPYRSFQRAYKKEIFALYQSYSQAGGQSGKEVAIDDRANIFKGPMVWIGALFVLLMLGGSGWGLWRFFHPVAKVDKLANKVNKNETASVSGVVAPASPPGRSVTPESAWRVVGDYRAGATRYVVVSRAGQLRTLINPHGFYYDALRVTGLMDGELVTNYTGAAAVGERLEIAK